MDATPWKMPGVAPGAAASSSQGIASASTVQGTGDEPRTVLPSSLSQIGPAEWVPTGSLPAASAYSTADGPANPQLVPSQR
jgi:hypothetical protein